MKRNRDVLPPAYEGVENHLLALFYSGVYITNAQMAEVGRELGLDLPMKDRTALLKQIMRHAHDNDMKPKMIQSFISVIKKRIKEYEALAKNFPEAAELVGGWIQKANATVLLLQREIRSSPYE